MKPCDRRNTFRFIQLGGTGLCRTTRNPGARQEVLVGRMLGDEQGCELVVDVSGDDHISRRHCRVWAGDNGLYIEDLGSRNGTLVDGVEIEGRGVVPVKPGSLIKTGATTWTVLPWDWLFARHADLAIYGPLSREFNYATYHCGLPLVGELTAMNLGGTPSDGITLVLQLSAYSDRCAIAVPRIPPGETLELGVPPIRVYAESLKRQAEPERAVLSVFANGVPLKVPDGEVTVLGFWDWPLDAALRTTIAAFVSPWNPLVERAVSAVDAYLSVRHGYSSYREALRSSTGEPERIVLEALYQSLLENSTVTYVEPRIRTVPGSSARYQAVRPPQLIFMPGDSLPQGSATCLDLAVFFAGCLENMGLSPIVIFTGQKDAVPRHAIAGCWAGGVPDGRPLIYDRELLSREHRAGSLLLVESTLIAEGSERSGKRSFAEAFSAAAERLESADWVCAVDIGSLRPPLGGITHLECSLEPVVARAYDNARSLAVAEGRETLETFHLLLSLLAEPGEVTRTLCGAAGLDVDLVSRRQAPRATARPGAVYPEPTRNTRECMKLAEEYASQARSASVREQDVLWALLRKSIESSSMRAVLRELGTDSTVLAQSLELLCQRPTERNSPTSFVNL